MLAVSGGRLILLSTPAGKRGAFYEAWVEGGPAWRRFEVRATDCPRIDPEFLADEWATLGPLWYGQEYMCEFQGLIGTLFPGELIDDAFVEDDGEDVIPLYPTGTPSGRRGA